jgi:hypothetical protein
MPRFPVAACFMPRAAVLAAAAAVIALTFPASASAAPVAAPAGTFSAAPLAGSTTLEHSCSGITPRDSDPSAPNVEFVSCADLIEFDGDLWGQTETFCQTPGGATILACQEVVATVEGASASASGQVSVGQGALLVACGITGHSACQAQKNFSKAQVVGAIPGNGPCQAWGVVDDISHRAPGDDATPAFGYTDSAGHSVNILIDGDFGSAHHSAACAA